MTRIKICGLSRACDIEAANSARPDYIGFVFAARSHRRVTPECAMALRERLHPSIQAVGVFVDESIEVIASIVERGAIDIVQLHGDEDEATIERIKALTGRPVIKAVRVRSRESVRRWHDTCADFLLLDSASGGSGECFDWDAIGDVKRPFFLAGGITLANIHAAIAKARPFAIDLSSGVETNALKDPAKIAAIVASLRD
ncbi:MAG: phosphoribosylanthranilate isomerase [Kiritimatiellaeota bacterium]|nr:phosphoribosylanthranilate isomerase [Kiritimatiellota bacterium]